MSIPIHYFIKKYKKKGDKLKRGDIVTKIGKNITKYKFDDNNPYISQIQNIIQEYINNMFSINYAIHLETSDINKGKFIIELVGLIKLIQDEQLQYPNITEFNGLIKIFTGIIKNTNNELLKEKLAKIDPEIEIL